MSKLKVYKTDSWVGDLKIRKGSEWKPATDVKTYNVKFDPTSVGAKLLKIDGDIGHLNILKITDTTVLKNELSKFEYLNDYSKSFGTTDGEVPNSEFWSIISGTPDIQNSSLHLVSDGATDEIVESTFYVSGDFSAEVDINLTSVSVSSWACEFKLYVDDTNYYKILRMYDAGSGRHAIDVYSMIGGVYTELTTNNQGLIDNVKFKFVRVGNTLYCRYWIGGASWVDLVTIPSCLTDDFKIRFESNVWDTNPSIDFYFDNFKIENPDAIVHSTELHPDEIYVEVKDDNLYKYFSDAFVGVDDALPNSQYWNDIPFASKSLRIYGNRLGGVVANQWPNTESVFKLQGDFDIRTDYLVDSVTNPQGWYTAMWLYADNDDRMGIERSYADRGGLGNYYTFDRVISSTWAPVYAVPTTADELSGKFRLTRDGTTLRAFYWDNDVGGWALIGTQEFVNTDLRVTYYLGTISGDNVLTAYFTDVFINSADGIVNFNKTIDDITPTIETAKESKILVQSLAGDGSIYTVTVDSNPVTYTKQAGDTIIDVAEGLGDALKVYNGDSQYTILQSNIGTSLTDTFTDSDGSPPNVEYWGTYDVYPLPEISSNKIYANNITDNIGMLSNYKLSGDFDVQIDFELLNQPSTGSYGFILNAYIDELNYIGIYRGLDLATPASVQKYQTHGRFGAGWVSINSELSSDSVGKLRMQRVGSLVTLSKWNGSGWDAVTSSYSFSSSDVYIFVRFGSWDSNPQWSGYADNFSVTADNIYYDNQASLMFSHIDTLVIQGDDQGTYKTEFVDVKDQVLSTDKLPWMRRYSGGVWR